MLTLYTAVGILRFEDCLKNHKTPIVINNHREYGLSEEEFILWSCLAFHIRQIHELHTAFSERLKLHNRSENIPTRTRLPNDEQRLAVGLLVDESGSMDWGDRITHARKTAIVLYDFCISLGIPITIYGHSTGYDDVDLYSYAEFDSLDASDRYRLMDMSARGGNRDGAALRFVAEHLAKRPETRKLLIIISDGQPAAGGYSGTAAEADLRGIKKEFQKRGVITFAAAIGDDKENIRRIYKDGFLDITRLEDLPKNMTQLVKQYLK